MKCTQGETKWWQLVRQQFVGGEICRRKPSDIKGNENNEENVDNNVYYAKGNDIFFFFSFVLFFPSFVCLLVVSMWYLLFVEREALVVFFEKTLIWR